MEKAAKNELFSFAADAHLENEKLCVLFKESLTLMVSLQQRLEIESILCLECSHLE